jgi:ornithine decarboxylase
LKISLDFLVWKDFVEFFHILTVNECREGPTQLCSVFGPTCDALDTISLAEQLLDMDLDELVYSKNMEAYCAASSTFFNGFPPAKVVHVNQ